MYRWLQRLFAGSAPASAPEAGAAPVAPAPAPPAPAAVQPAAAPPAAPLATGAVSFEQRDRVDRAYFEWLFESTGECSLEPNQLEIQVLESLSALINSEQSGAALVRRLPGLIPQLMQTLRSDTFSGARLSRTISNDVVLVAAVIRLANRAFRGSGTTITSVEHAVMLIGHEGLRHLITSVAFRPIIDLNSGYYTRTLAPRMWDQSERCAVASRLMADAMRVDPFEAFLAGLLQNVGLIVTLRMMDQVAKNEKELGSEMFCARLARDARVLTTGIGNEWNFPESVMAAVGEQARTRKGAQVSPLGRLLTMSDYLSKVHILTEAGRLPEDDPALLRGLPDDAIACYRALAAAHQDAMAPAATSAS